MIIGVCGRLACARSGGLLPVLNRGSLDILTGANVLGPIRFNQNRPHLYNRWQPDDD
jgi:hypothetical protein